MRTGRPKTDDAKQLVSLRLSPDVLAYWRGLGDGWQSKVNDALRAAMVDGQKPAPAAAVPDIRAKAPIPPTKPGRMTMDDVRPKFTSRLKPEKGQKR